MGKLSAERKACLFTARKAREASVAVDGSHGSVVAFKPATRASCCVVMVERSGSTRVMLDEGSCAREASCCHGLVDASLKRLSSDENAGSASRNSVDPGREKL